MHDPLSHEFLLSDKFFDVKRYPTLRFVSHGIRRHDAHDAVDFDVTIHDVTKTVTFLMTPSPVVPFEGTKYLAFTFTGEISRSAFGMVWQQPEPLEDPLFGDAFAPVLHGEFIDHPRAAPPPK